ncbi:deoxyuridine 5'-triphosphate nucleotidohydrolase-like [Oppia nitens]|uniref:deoxyuridine 5'-triphosphate nucleotidohydrolase-like n=1 Tax=Oppia nitens TaxID=1686743 RepID=UPI0023D9BBBC|nr:deoxyuridine 5'-triphosphate nucleotidohydrolase-like [Oppia nitens]
MADDDRTLETTNLKSSFDVMPEDDYIIPPMTRKLISVKNTNNYPYNSIGEVQKNLAIEDKKIIFSVSNNSNVNPLILTKHQLIGTYNINFLRTVDERTIEALKSNYPVYMISAEKRLIVNIEFGSLLPVRETYGSAGLDLFSVDDISILPDTRSLVSTGLRVQLPKNTFGHILPRSSLALKGIDIGAGVIDNDFTGTIKVLMINNSKQQYEVTKGQKIAQLVVMDWKYLVPYCGKITETIRNTDGFGSTDIN